MRETCPDDDELLARLLDFYLYDFSELDGSDIGSDGSHGYPWLEAYRRDDDRASYLFEVGEHPAGFALVRLTDPTEVAEFFVLRKYRRTGVGTAAARTVIARHPGRWLIKQIPANAAAIAFWRAAIPVAFDERVRPDGRTE